MEEAVLSQVFAATAISSVVARLSGGLALDTMAPKNVLAGGLLLQAMSMFLMARLSTITVLIAPVVQGLSMGVVMNVASVAYANFFGRAHVGGITGAATSALVLGSALGPFPFGVVRDWTGSFDLAFFASAVLSLIFAVMVYIFAKRPTKANMSVASNQEKVENL